MRSSLFRGITLVLVMALGFPGAALSRESLGLYQGWGAFRDPLVPRCYAIAKAEPSKLRRDYDPYATVATWPRKGIRDQVHLRLSRQIARNSRIILKLGGRSFDLTGGGGDAWPRDQRDNAAIVAALRSAPQMTVSARDDKGGGFSNTWKLGGVASAMDSAAIGCAQLR